jgi:hypothetical protein
MNKPNFKRKNVRFSPVPNTTLWVSKSVLNFDEDFLGLVDSEAQKGCGAIFNQETGFAVGDFCLVKVGKLAPLKSQVVWMSQIDDSIYRMGFHFLE